MAPLLFAVLCAGVFLTSTEAQGSFSKLPDIYKKGVELALKEVNGHATVQNHFVFFSTIQQSKIEAGFDVIYVYHNFYLKPTKCKKGTEITDLTKCPFRNDRPPIDCAICYKTYAGEIEQEPKPFLSCVHKPALTEDIQKQRVDRCNEIGYGSGSPTLLASIGS